MSRTVDKGSSNASAMESPMEEIERLLAQARRGELTMRGASGGARVLEQRERCYANGPATGATCPDPTKPNRWPEGAPRGLRPVLMYQRWWISNGSTPRMLRADNGVLDPDGSHRRVVFTVEYRAWRVLPRTAEHLSLVRVPRLDPADYLVVEGSSMPSSMPCARAR